jgi:hypothetical protein
VHTVSPPLSTTTLSRTTSASRKLGQPCARDSAKNCSMVRRRGATNRRLPVTLS